MIKNIIFLKFIKYYLDRFFEGKPSEFQPYILNIKYFLNTYLNQKSLQQISNSFKNT